MTPEQPLLENIMGEFTNSKRFNPFLNSMYLGVCIFCLLITSVVGLFDVPDIFYIYDKKMEWFYSQIILFSFVVIFWLASPYIISIVKEKKSLIFMVPIFLVVCFIRKYKLLVMEYTVAFYAIGLMIIWTCAGSYMLTITKNISFRGSCFGIFIGIAGSYRLFNQINRRGDLTTISCLIFLLISALMAYLLSKPTNEEEMEHHHITEYREALLSPIKLIKNDQNKDFLILLPILFYLGLSNRYIDFITGNFPPTYYTYSIFFLVSSMIVGWLSDRLEIRKIFIVVAALSTIAFIFSFLSTLRNPFGQLGYYHVISSLMGIINASLYILVYVTINSLYSLDKSLSVASNSIFIIQIGSFVSSIQFILLFKMVFIFLFIILFVSLYIILFKFKNLDINNYNIIGNDINNNSDDTINNIINFIRVIISSVDDMDNNINGNGNNNDNKDNSNNDDHSNLNSNNNNLKNNIGGDNSTNNNNDYNNYNLNYNIGDNNNNNNNNNNDNNTDNNNNNNNNRNNNNNNSNNSNNSNNNSTGNSTTTTSSS